MTQIGVQNPKTFIDELLQEQHRLTAVARFAQKHERAEISLQGRYYRDLLPLTKPGVGEQYAFEVDLDQCSGCKACVAACHNLNGLEADESWRATGLLVTDGTGSPFQQTVTTACHHCVDPACLNGCPVLAYEKDPSTGIVRHLDDQCIGCQYCVLKCPYEVPRYSSRLGIVRKCDMCHNRLSAGEAPACVQSCPSEAIRITLVSQSQVSSDYRGGTMKQSFLPASPDPAYTLPATRYLSSKGMPAEMRAADEANLRPALSHWPLVWMLVLTQAGVGGLWFQFLHESLGGERRFGELAMHGALILAGLLASILHLGRPLQAWRAFIGVRRSWLSREIIAFGALASSVLLLLGMEVLPFQLPFVRLGILGGVVAMGATSLLCSTMVYVDTPREFWAWRQTVPRFIGTAILVGGAIHAAFHPETSRIYFVISAAAAIKAGIDLHLLRALSGERLTAMKRSALLLTGELLPVTLTRLVSLLGGIALAQFCFAAGPLVPAIVPMCLAVVLLMSEIAERLLFFRAVSQPAMPGSIS